MRNILNIFVFLLSLVINTFGAGLSMVIDVDAGDDATICYGETLNLIDLGASISGDVSDGLWFTQGDGIFLPGNQTNGIFSTTTQYQPGPQDQSNGSFTLILVSDDPDGNGPMVEVSDLVTISFMSAPALVCNNSINVSLAESCEQEVDVFMVLANPAVPYNKYIIELFDDSGLLIPDNILTVDHIGMDVTFSVGHDCTSAICGGEITVSDNIAPFLNCVDATLDCAMGTSPEEAGLPIPFYASATSTGTYTYDVVNFDDCGVVSLTYNDLEEELTCASTGYVKQITRSWYAEDESGNSSSCEQIILLNPLPLDSVVVPSNYDGADNPPLSCNGDWEMLDNGYPSPEETGTPSFPDCGNIAATYTDAYFEECGAGFKVVRQWFVIDWCTTTSFNHNQIIKVLDTEGPEFECPDDITLSSQAYSCVSKSTTLEFIDQVSDCSDYESSFGLLNLDGQDITASYVSGNTINNLPIGEYQLVYIATDVCGNSSECSTSITVIDDSAPFAVCDGFTTVSVSNNGIADMYATSIDDDSFDNCGEITMEIAKMTDECGWGLAFGPKAHFCCDEIGDTVMVAFRVTDAVGLSNICMVSVFVEDKLPPVIECPSDLTLSCNVAIDLDNLSVFGEVLPGTSAQGDITVGGNVLGQNGFYYDNCEATVSETYTEDLDCDSGTIIRTFTATDLYGETASCTQTITVINDNPFYESDISWPSNYEMNGCDTIQANPTITGEPILSDDKCAQVASTYEDQYFFISGGACVKVLREWTVIDWCQFETGSQNGLWTYTQEIKLKNNIAPTILDCVDKEICSYDDDCQSELVTITALANDDCTDSLNLLYLWKLDLDDDGSIDETGEGITFDKELNLGAHRVYWIVEDGCGNQSLCNYQLDVRDCKNPTPYCTSSITTTVMPSSGSIEIWASDFDYGSTDNCTEPGDLVFSFSQDLNDTSREINCDSIQNGVAQLFNLEMWVTDEWGNQERCFVSFIVQDNQDVCNDTGVLKGRIEGKVFTQKGKSLPEAEIDITASIDTFSGFEMTDENGKYEVEKTPEYINYTLRPYYSSSAKAGVSTLDLVQIQRHILDIAPFDNPYDILASDVSGNEKVNSSDLLVVRKMILGIIIDWPQDLENWAFIDSAYVFEDETDPYQYPDSIQISALDDSTGLANFVAVKIGDVNGSYSSGFAGGKADVDTRSAYSLPMSVNKSQSDDMTQYALVIDTEDIIDGLQMSITVPEDVELSSSFLSPEDYIIQDGVLKISWVNIEENELDGETFILLESAKDINLELTDDINPEIYVDLEAVNLTLNRGSYEIDNESTSALQELTAVGNPFSHNLILQTQSVFNELSLEIYNSEGKIVFRQRYANQQSVQVPSEQFERSGIYFVNYELDGNVGNLKVVRI